jgi:RNA polymerase sigma factor (sigma-70 family)
MKHQDDVVKLVTAAQAGDERAFNALVVAFEKKVIGHARRMLYDDDLADDIAQESFLEAYLNLPRLGSPLAFPTWLHTILVRQCSRLRRHRSVETVPISSELEYMVDPAALEHSPDLHPEQGRIQAALAGLTREQQVAVQMYYVDRRSQQEIADALRITPNTVRKRLQAARVILRRKMTDLAQYTD